MTLGITDDIRISARPAEATDRAVPGHWEGDLLLGAQGKGAVITLVERSTRYVLLAPLPGRHTADAGPEEPERADRHPAAVAAQVDHLGPRLGDGPARPGSRVDTGIPIYFCDPHAPWQRGTNENTNGLLRQYWPKGADMRHLTQTDCDDVALSLNTRPRKTLDWQTPGQALNRGSLQQPVESARCPRFKVTVDSNVCSREIVPWQHS